MKILIFSLGFKGFRVVKALFESSIKHSIECVIGKDDGVVDDYSLTLASFCDQQKIPYLVGRDATFDKGDYDLFLAIGWRWIVRGITREKLIVFHDSLLPRYRGFAPLVNALVKREKETGVTALLGAEEYDRGNILLQKRLDVIYPTTIEREIQRISDLYADLAVELIKKLDNGELDRAGCPQDEKCATYSLWLDEEDYRINWNENAVDIEHFINCVGKPYRGASAILNDSIVRIFKARAQPDRKIENRTAGKVIFIESQLPIVVCGSGLLSLEDVRDEDDKTVLPLKYFRSRFY